MRGGALGEKGKNIEPLGDIGQDFLITTWFHLLCFTCGKV
jgi:hypothetical protein